MYDWTDDLTIQAAQSFPTLRCFIYQAVDMGDIERLIELLLATGGCEC